jgi:hypothetical protein
MVRLACSKNRLALVKKIPLPHLELLVALVGARLLQYFCREKDGTSGAPRYGLTLR